MYTSTGQRNHVCDIAISKNELAHKKAKEIEDPWFKTQALSHVARFSPEKTISIAKEAEKTASLCISLCFVERPGLLEFEPKRKFQVQPMVRSLFFNC